MTEDLYLAEPVDIETVWQAPLRPVGCLACGAVHLVPAAGEIRLCPACLSDDLEAQPTRLRPEPPELAVPFDPSLTPISLSASLVKWLGGMWLRPQDLQVERLIERLIRVYLPMWLIDGQVVGDWRARMGFDYQVESSQERFSDGAGWKTRRFAETRTRWEPRVGWLHRAYHNVTVPALEEGEQQSLLDHLGRYELGTAVVYTPAIVADAVVRVPGLLPEEAWPIGRAAFDRSVLIDLQRAAGAQHGEEFELNASYYDLNWTQLLLPYLLTYYHDDAGRPVPVWVNGQNGRIDGVRRSSMRQAWQVGAVVGALAAATFVCGVGLSLLNRREVAALLMTIGLLVAFIAALPVLWAWQFNRRPL